MDGSPPAPIDGASLTPCARTALAFLEWAFADTDPAGLVEIAFTGSDGGNITRARLFPNTPAGRADAARFAASVNAAGGVNVYFAPALRLASAAADRRARRTDVLGSWLAWADFDAPGAIEAATPRWRELALPPHRVVVTGRTPSTRAQAFWRLAEPFADFAALDSALAGLHVGLGKVGDPKVVNADRVMRLPGMIAWPKPGKAGRVAERTELAEPQGARPAPIGLAEFHGVFPPADPVAARRSDAPGDADLFNAPAAPVAAHGETRGPSAPTEPQRPPAPAAAPERAFDRLGRRIDGRDAYAMQVIGGAIRGLAAALGRWPTADELSAEAWPTYERNAGPKNPASTLEAEGRGFPWFREKCATHARRAAGGAIAGLETVEKARAAEAARAMQRAPGAAFGASASNDARSARERLGFRAFADDSAPVLADDWTVDDVIPREGFGVIYGAPGCGKTFTALDLALAVGGGAERWHGKPVDGGAVLYLSMEGGALFANRLAAWRKVTGRAAPWFFRSPANVDLRGPHDSALILEAAREIAADAGRPVKLIVVDTLSRAMPGGNENAAEDMTRLIGNCEAVRKALGCFVLIVHHSGKDEGRGMRGHSSLFGAVDTELPVTRGCVEVKKQRDGEEGARFGFRLEVVDLGVSTRGRRVTSCVSVPAEIVQAPPEQARMPANARAALEALTIFVDDCGKPNPAGTGWPEAGRFRVVEWEAFRAFARDRMPQDGQRQQNEAVRRGVKWLTESGVVAMNGGFVWLTR